MKPDLFAPDTKDGAAADNEKVPVEDLRRVEQMAPPFEPPPSSEDFDWAKDDSIVLREQPATAIYFTEAGSLVIRQEADWSRDEDSFVFIAKANQQAFIDAICDALGIGSAP